MDLRPADAGVLRFERNAGLPLVLRLRRDRRHCGKLCCVVSGPDSACGFDIEFWPSIALDPAADRSGSATAPGYVGWIRRRARFLSNGVDGDERRQRLRHDVLPADTGALLSALFHAVVVDPRSAIRSERNVFRRPGARDDRTPHVVVSVPVEKRAWF